MSNFLLGFVAVIGRLIIKAPLSGEIVGDFSPAWLASLQEIAAMIARVVQAMYLGVIQAISDRSVIMLLIVPIPAIVAAGVSYLVGIRYKDGFKTKTNTPKTNRYS